MTTLVLIGGFLGGGKTTLILEAARRLAARGLRVGIVMNDQAGQLVDTRLARAEEFDAGEVTGGCFCCRFTDLAQTLGGLLAANRDVIFAEPVGSCADLAATVLAPLERFHSGQYRLAPYSVVADPRRAHQLLAPGADERLSYLFRKQLEEAGLVLQTKADLPAPPFSWPGVPNLRLSARTGEGVDEWLDLILQQTWANDRPELDIDYALYAGAEAALAWLNWRAHLESPRALPPAFVAGPLLDALDSGLTAASIPIAHLKVFVQTNSGYLKASVCINGQEPIVQGRLDAPPARRHEIVLNLRATAAPEQVTAILQNAAAQLPGRLQVHSLECFRPSPPRPEHRLTRDSKDSPNP